jgi:hypothetical protein
MGNLAKSKRLFYLIPLLFWGLTLFFRIPHVNNDVPINNVAHTFMLQTLQIWNDEGPFESCFAMKHTYQNSGDKFITYYKRYCDADGNNYYVSHPSLAQALAWVLSGGGFISPSNSYLMWLAMFMHLVGAYFLMFLILQIFKTHTRKWHAAIFGVFMYLFHPVLLYMNTFHFFAESVGQMLFVAASYLVFRNAIEQNNRTPVSWMLLFISSFLFVSAEWMGVFFCFALMVMVFVYGKSIKQKFFPMFIVCAGGVVAVLVFVFQHVSLYEPMAFFKAMGIRFLERSGFFGDHYTDMGYSYANPNSYLLLLKQVGELLKGVGVLFLLPILAWFINRKQKAEKRNPHFRFLIGGLFLACFLFLIVFFSATITHYIYTARFVLPLILLSVMALISLPDVFLKKVDRSVVWFFVGLIMGWSLWVFNQKSALLVYPDEQLHQLAAKIGESADEKESIFYINPQQYPTTTVIWLSYASGRNIAAVNDAEGVCKYMAMLPDKYMLVYFEDNAFNFQHGKCTKKGE